MIHQLLNGGGNLIDVRFERKVPGNQLRDQIRFAFSFCDNQHAYLIQFINGLSTGLMNNYRNTVTLENAMFSSLAKQLDSLLVAFAPAFAQLRLEAANAENSQDLNASNIVSPRKQGVG